MITNGGCRSTTRKLFEMPILEGVQAGLSWSLILKKRAGYLEAFDGLEANKVAHFDDTKVQELLVNPGIVRNRLKIQATIQNARAFLQVQSDAGSFERFLWQFAFMQAVGRVNNHLVECFRWQEVKALAR